MRIDRRRVLSLFAWGAVVPTAATAAGKTPAYAGHVEFLHGVASGDPLVDRMILWTRVTPKEKTSAKISVVWEIAEDASFKRLAAHGTTDTGPARDYTVKIDAGGLKAGHDYHYRFRAGKAVSPAGRARTLPSGDIQDVVLAFTSCALYPAGYFNAYDHIAKLERVDAVVELGDYYYEMGAADDDYGMTTGRKIGRIPEPAHEIITLDDYRARHALYKRDVDLQAAHARAPWICVWDDHETANDSWMGGAQNHQPATEGSWLSREAAALQAYYEWMPIREPERGQAATAINRSFQFGDLASLIMVESRLVARSRQLRFDRPGDIPQTVFRIRGGTRERVIDEDVITRVLAEAKEGKKPSPPYIIGPDVPALLDKLNHPERQMMGVPQEEWLGEEIARSVARGQSWQVLGNQVVMARCISPDLGKAVGWDKVEKILATLPEDVRKEVAAYLDLITYDVPWDLDGWEGYPAARERVYDAIKTAQGNVIVVSGDSHAFWVNELYDASRSTRVAAEFGTSSVTSPGIGDEFPFVDVGKLYQERNPEVLFNDQSRKGYVLLTLTREKAVADLVTVEHLTKPYKAGTLHSYAVSPADGPGVGAIEKI